MSRRRANRGHNLLEMVLAVFIFLTVSTALAMVWIQHSRSIKAQGMRLTAQHVCEQTMEECIAAGYVNVDTLAGPRPNIGITDVLRGDTQTLNFKIRVTVTLDAIHHWKVVLATVDWEDNVGQNTITFKTFLAEHT